MAAALAAAVLVPAAAVPVPVPAVAQPGLVQALHAQARSRALVPAGPDSRLTAR
jgi:hypothetical protein